ncbi:histidine phosphatase family protein [Thiolapillus sp.]
MSTRLDFIRHGEPEGGRLYRGAAIDDPLSDKGWKQMWQAVGENCHWERIVSSPLQRCHAFALALGEKHDLPVTVEADFREVGFGRWEGRSPADIQQQAPEEYAAFYADPVHNRPPGAEDLPAFGRRVAKAFENTASAHTGKRVLVVAHAGVIRAVLGHVMQAPPAAWYRAKVDNAGLSRFLLDEKGRQLIFHNLPRLPDALYQPL